jgi:outer membrane immunogenic protein
MHYYNVRRSGRGLSATGGGMVALSALLACFLASLAAEPAFAESLAPPPVPAASPRWTGFYVGVNAGYGWGATRSDTNPNGFNALVPFIPLNMAHENSLKSSGAVGGFQAGYNQQIGNRWIAGAEADWQMSGENATLHYVDPYSLILQTGAVTTDYKVTPLWFGTVRGRLGYAFDDGLFAYATGGLAYGSVRLAGTVNNGGVSIGGPYNGTSPFNTTELLGGWTIGGGVEGALINNLSWKAEYLYLNLAAMSTMVGGPFQLGTVQIQTGRLTNNIVRAGLNLRLGP